jgi:hypothetical protein
LDYWLAIEVWLDNDEVEAVNALGEVLPLEDTEWPWPEDDNGE